MYFKVICHWFWIKFWYTSNNAIETRWQDYSCDFESRFELLQSFGFQLFFFLISPWWGPVNPKGLKPMGHLLVLIFSSDLKSRFQSTL